MERHPASLCSPHSVGTESPSPVTLDLSHNGKGGDRNGKS